jgi:hypothetical protein
MERHIKVSNTIGKVMKYGYIQDSDLKALRKSELGDIIKVIATENKEAQGAVVELASSVELKNYNRLMSNARKLQNQSLVYKFKQLINGFPCLFEGIVMPTSGVAENEDDFYITVN